MTLQDRRQQDVRDIRAVSQTREGARFLSWLLELCGVYRTSYNGEETHAMAFKEGARNVGLAVLNALDIADETAWTRVRDADKERTVDLKQ